LIPPGEYVAQAIEATVALLQSGKGHGLTLVWKIMEGEFENRQIWQFITFTHTNETAQSIGRRMIKDICDAMRITGAVTDASVFLFTPVRVKLGIEKDKAGLYDDKNKVSRVTSLEAVAPAAPAANSTASKASKSAPAPAGRPGPNGSAPWKR
jgi:hypothetical protein